MSLRILFVENHVAFATTVVSAFLSNAEVVIIGSMREFRNVVLTNFDVALVDYDLDDCKGTEIVKVIRMTDRSLPIVAVSSHDDGNARLIAAGANDACPKASFSRIAAVFERLQIRSRGVNQ